MTGYGCDIMKLGACFMDEGGRARTVGQLAVVDDNTGIFAEAT